MNKRIPNLFLIFAVDENNVIGKNNDIPWHSPHDFDFFKKTTGTSNVVMGRKTWESLPRKPLPNRDNYVLTGDFDYIAEGAVATTTLAGAIYKCKIRNAARPIFVIGGKAIYEIAAKQAAEAYISRIGAATPVDDSCVMAPELPPYEIINTYPVFEGDDKYPSVRVEHVRFLD